jgi:hypothetical protein
MPTVIRSDVDSSWAIFELDREMGRPQREKWRREIDDEILPSLLIEQMTGDSDARSSRSCISAVYTRGFFTATGTLEDSARKQVE